MTATAVRRGWIRSVALAAAAMAAGAGPAGAQAPTPGERAEAQARVKQGPADVQVVREVVREVPRIVQRAVVSAFSAVRLDEQRGDGRAVQTDREVKTLSLGATGLLDLRNVSGDISVAAGSGREVTIEIVRQSRGRTDADAKTGLDRVKVTVSQQGERGTVQSEYPSERQAPYSVSTSFTVTAPPGTRVNISSVSGDALLKNIKGDVAVSLVSGRIDISGGGRISQAQTISGDVSLTDITSDDSVKLGTVSGELTLQRVKARRIDADVTSGDIVAREVTCDSVEFRSLSGSITYVGPLARGGRYALQTHSGSVRFTPTGNVGFEFQGTTFNGSIRPDAGLGMKGTSSTRGRLRGTVGDGSATVTATTFSGDVVIGKQ